MNLDTNCVVGLHQKRMLAFINHFVTKTVQFLNNFACQCELKIMAFELKMEKIEASLKILEAKLSSIPDLKQETQAIPVVSEVNVTIQTQDTEISESIPSEENTPAYDPQYDKYFKMLQFGVPLQAVKLKIIQEGLDPSVLDLKLSA